MATRKAPQGVIRTALQAVILVRQIQPQAVKASLQQSAWVVGVFVAVTKVVGEGAVVAVDPLEPPPHAATDSMNIKKVTVMKMRFIRIIPNRDSQMKCCSRTKFLGGQSNNRKLRRI
jgi:hypothetical protein